MKYAFEHLEVWKDSRELTKLIYELSSSFPNEEQFGLTSQLRRAVVPISLNIVEGSSRISKKDQANFYKNAFSSATEVLGALFLALDLNYINENDLSEIRPKIEKVTNKLNALRKAILNKT